ncbi:MAG: UDP-N-acetylmuramoyl-tripeptide--D-alanyl-D-alanine ligase [Defluviitaleaceae bacterium]|nr:UDP-N-acetylmuramoyl-tripeptide--D-alanyl-D-alanine ligase [Defluviitaleaceae bacterium]
MKLDINEIIKACGGRLLNESTAGVTITGVSTDTRKISPGALFVPIVGEQFDGHDYIGQAAESGAVCALTEKHSPVDIGIPLVYVTSTRRALLDLAGYYRQRHDVKVVAVTGSAGKTTTKDMMYHVLSRKYKTKKTMGNFNNDIGLPLSIFQLEPGDEMLVLEMGMNHANEIHELSLTGAPDICVITHIGDAHIENFENREGILHAKLEIIDGLKPGGTVVLNGDDPLLTGKIARAKTGPFRVLYPGAENIIKSEPMGLRGSRCQFQWRGENLQIDVPMPGAHMVMNALLAAVVGLEMGVPAGEIAGGFADFTPPEGRLTVIEANDKKIISDVYNSNPAAVREAIKVLCREKTAQNRTVAILGDIAELGHVAVERHKELGVFAAESDIDLLIAIGTLSRHIYEEFLSAGDACADSSQNGRTELPKARHFSTVSEFLENYQDLLNPEDVVLIKASRSMAFENITNAITN